MNELIAGLREKLNRKRTKLAVVQPLSMRLLVVVAMLALLVQTFTMLYVVLREQRSVQVTVINK